MRPDLPWNVAGVPPEAREAARAAARREGLSVGEWLTRRILRSLTEIESTFDDASTDAWAEPVRERPAQRREAADEATLDTSHHEFDAEGACRRIEDEVLTFSRRFDAAERSQSEGHRALNKATAEISVASREHARAVDELSSSVTNLSHRIERVERQAPGEGLRDAVRGLHQGLTRLADQLSHAASHSADQISTLTDRLESVAERLGQTKLETDSVARRLESRGAQIDEHFLAIERRIETNASDIARAAENALAVARLEESLARVEARSPDASLDRRLNSIERALADIPARTPIPDPRNSAVEDQVRALAARIESSERQQRETESELRQAIDALPRVEARDEPAVTVAPEVEDHRVVSATLDPSPPDALSLAPDATQPPARDLPHNAPKPQDLPEAFAPTLAPVDAPPPLSEDQPPSPLHDSFLAAARRSAQAAAAQAEVERASGGFGGFAWNTRAEPAKSPASRYGRLVGLSAIALIVLVLAGYVFTHRPAYRAPATGGVSTELARKGVPAAAKPQTRNISGALPGAPVRSTSSSAPVTAPAPQTAVAPPASSAGAPSTIGELQSPRSDRLAAADAHGVNSNNTPSAQQVSPAANAKPAPLRAVQNAAALDRLTALANLGNARAETIVGLRYLDGDGVAPNESEAAKWLARAAEHGSAVAQYRLGTLYEHGHGVPADPAKALHWYQAAAQAGNRKAMHNLAVAYAQGTGVPKDFFEAARWFSKAAGLGLADSQFNLAVLYERGLGVPQNLIDAYKWYAIAAAQGDTESKARIEAIATQLRADDRAAAQRSADQFRPAPLNAAANVPPQLNDISG